MHHFSACKNISKENVSIFFRSTVYHCTTILHQIQVTKFHTRHYLSRVFRKNYSHHSNRSIRVAEVIMLQLPEQARRL